MFLKGFEVKTRLKLKFLSTIELSEYEESIFQYFTVEGKLRSIWLSIWYIIMITKLIPILKADILFRTGTCDSEINFIKLTFATQNGSISTIIKHQFVSIKM